MVLKKFTNNEKITYLFITLMLVINPIGIALFSNFEKNEKIPTYLEEGDLLFCDGSSSVEKIANQFGLDTSLFHKISGFSNDHVAMYIGDNTFIESFPYYWHSSEKKYYGVVKSNIDLIDFWATNITYGFVKDASFEQKKQAVNWALEKLGQPYGYVGGSIYFSDGYYCSELVSEAYESQGLDISIFFGSDIELYNENEIHRYWYPGYYFNMLFNCFFDLTSDF